MSPRHRPKTSDPDQALADVATMPEIRAVTERGTPDQRRQGLLNAQVTSEPGIYRLGGPHSFFRDLAVDQLARKREDTAASHPAFRGREGLDPGHAGFELLDVQEARARLRAVRLEQRDVTTADPGAAGLLPSGAPKYIADEFATAARAQATLAAAMRVLPIPDAGLTVDIPRITTGPSAAIQATEGGTISETDVDAAVPVPSSPVGTVAGQADVTRQALERSSPAFDVVLAAELGRAFGAVLDQQIVAGSGSSGETTGLANTTGRVTHTFTDASPSAPKTIGKLWELYRQLADPAVGYGVAEPASYLVAVHTRTFAYIMAAGASATTEQSGTLRIPGTLVPCGAVRTTLGAGSDSEAFAFVREQAPVFTSELRIRAHEASPISDSLKVRYSVVAYVAMHALRQPRAVGHSTGTGWTNYAAL